MCVRRCSSEFGGCIAPRNLGRVTTSSFTSSAAGAGSDGTGRPTGGTTEGTDGEDDDNNGGMEEEEGTDGDNDCFSAGFALGDDACGKADGWDDDGNDDVENGLERLV